MCSVDFSEVFGNCLDIVWMTWGLPAEMTTELPRFEAIFLSRSAEIVDDHQISRRSSFVGDQSHMVQSAIKFPPDNIASLPILVKRATRTLAAQKGCHVRHSSVIDV